MEASFYVTNTLQKSRKMRPAGHVARMGEIRNYCKILVGNNGEKRPSGRQRHTWENNIKVVLK
jgi:hypothetical protein